MATPDGSRASYPPSLRNELLRNSVFDPSRIRERCAVIVLGGSFALRGLEVDSDDDEWNRVGLHIWFDFALGNAPFMPRLATAMSPWADAYAQLVTGAHGIVLRW